MVEYIEREAALTEFQKVCDICMTLVEIPMCGECSVADTVRKVKRIPAADVIKVVRCKNCKYASEHYDTDGNVPYWTCSEWDSGTDYDGFCYLGEQKDD